MALSYQWKWLRGQKLTAKFDCGTTALGETFGPVILSSNLVELPTAGVELLGVVPESAAASATGVPVIISNDIFEVQVKTGVNLALGDPVAIEADGSVDALGAAESCVGYVVDYDPATAGIAHIQANFTALAASQGTGEVRTADIADSAVTAAKIASDAVETAKILDANVTAAKLAANAVETAKIAADAVNTDKLDATIGTLTIDAAGGTGAVVLAGYGTTFLPIVTLASGPAKAFPKLTITDGNLAVAIVDYTDMTTPVACDVTNAVIKYIVFKPVA